MTDTDKNRPLRVFLCHASADKPAVRELYRRLRTYGFAPWLDEEALLPGQKWEIEIPKAVRASDVVLVCLSQHSINKTGYVQKEIKFALDVADEQPEGVIFLIPLKLEECDVPERLKRWQWVNLFSHNGHERLARALQRRMNDLGLVASQPISPAALLPRSQTEPAPEPPRYTPEPSPQSDVSSPDIVMPGPLPFPILPEPPSWQCPNVEDIFYYGEEEELSEDDLREKADVINNTLKAFGVDGIVVEVNRGPTITQFGVEPGFVQRSGKVTRVKVSQIATLEDDLKLALAAKTIHIEPMSGRNIVGIEVPNDEIATVALRDMIESDSFQKVKHKSALPIALGQDVSGNATTPDLATMPHLLIVGKNGSGKSVCINAIIACLMTHLSPNSVRFLMIDPKRVELTPYNGVPHLLAPVVVDMEKATGVLSWVVREMNERYRKFEKSSLRNIGDYNAGIIENISKEGATLKSILPYIVVVIDGLAELMRQMPREAERTIYHLVQNAHATGIHLIITTHADAVTRSIKSNIPARVAFSVASVSDSRSILDAPGAERLLGYGDMLYRATENEPLQRLRGCFVSYEEIHRLVDYWKKQTVTRTAIGQAGTIVEDDSLLLRAIEVVRIHKKASVSLLQQQLQLGYPRAAVLIEQLEEKGIIGPAKEDSRWRDVLDSGR